MSRADVIAASILAALSAAFFALGAYRDAHGYGDAVTGYFVGAILAAAALGLAACLVDNAIRAARAAGGAK